ncbi:MAG: tellurite resistance TerB family protein [Oleiphilaceae bacterium]|nr:hypothetical protein A3762_10810 [Oleiphilus sp. HI0125]MCH2157317.1 tellurite resistance TerB family protein [Oleiphilaceae bacterium]
MIATLVASKSRRKIAGKAAKYGGAALLGGLAYKAYKDWQHTGQAHEKQPARDAEYEAPSHQASRFQSSYEREAVAHINQPQQDSDFELRLVKAMIASARADGQIDLEEQRRIAETVNRLDLSVNVKSELLNLFLQPVPMVEIVGQFDSMEQKAEIYLASCLAIELDDESEYRHLSLLSKALNLPAGLEHQLRAQAQNVKVEVA